MLSGFRIFVAGSGLDDAVNSSNKGIGKTGLIRKFFIKEGLTDAQIDEILKDGDSEDGFPTGVVVLDKKSIISLGVASNILKLENIGNNNNNNNSRPSISMSNSSSTSTTDVDSEMKKLQKLERIGRKEERKQQQYQRNNNIKVLRK